MIKKAIYRYAFEDGTVLNLLHEGLSTEEIWKLEELHGKCTKTDRYLLKW